MQFSKLIRVKYLPATMNKGARIQLSGYGFNRPIEFPYDYQIGQMKLQALALLNKAGYKPITTGCLDKVYDYICIQGEWTSIEKKIKELR